MINKNLKLSEKIFELDIEKVPVRDGFGEGLVTAGQENKDIVVVSADLKDSVRITKFAEQFPERFFECGVAEQAMITVSSGLANAGKIPFSCTFAMFSPGRTWEQIRTTIAINNFPVKIAGFFGGVSVGFDGVTHQALEDIALMRVLPDMTVLAPSDSIEAQKSVKAAIGINGPVYIRVPRVESPVYTTIDTPFEVGHANVLWTSRNPQATIIGYGPIIYEALLAAHELEQIGLDVQVVNMHTIKPLDEETLINAARISGAIVTVEDHQIAGGLGSAVSEIVAQRHPVPMEFVGVHDQFGESGKPDDLAIKFCLKSKNIIEAVKKVVARKQIIF